MNPGQWYSIVTGIMGGIISEIDAEFRNIIDLVY
jgi:hypothetical protein